MKSLLSKSGAFKTQFSQAVKTHAASIRLFPAICEFKFSKLQEGWGSFYPLETEENNIKSAILWTEECMTMRAGLQPRIQGII